MKSAVLFLVFNRPNTTYKVFEAIRAAKPPRLYVAADGPRDDRPNEAELCKEVRSLATAIDWPCELKTLFRDKNLGCKLAGVSAIDWFFEHEEEGIILEDDILPISSFFDYCDELLERYRYNENIALISGCNLITSDLTIKDSYFFSRYPLLYGWATWRRFWKHYDVTMKDWPNWRDQGGLSKVSGKDIGFKDDWTATLNKAYAGKIDAWDFQLVFACWKLGNLVILPAKNQTTNIGFGKDATHTTSSAPDFVLKSKPAELSFPLQHPETIERHIVADSLLHRKVFGTTLSRAFKIKIKKYLARLNIKAD